jgi:uncharacterized membrane protein HdeD (DUF308 family)
MAKSVAKTQKNEDPIMVGLRSTTLFGGLILLVGVGMLFFPVYSTFLSTAVFGWLIIFAGVISIFNAIVRRESGFWGRLIGGLIFFALGAFVLRNPFAFIATATLFIIAYFFVAGIFDVVESLANKNMPNRGFLAVKGVIDLILAIILWSSFPETALWLIGLLLGINFIMTGIVMMAASSALKSGYKNS